MPRPKFSLLSLLIFSLFCASAMLLYVHIPPWRISRTLVGEYERVIVAPNGQFVLTTQQNEAIVLHESAGNAIVRLPEKAEFAHELRFSPDSRYVILERKLGADQSHDREYTFWETATHQLILDANCQKCDSTSLSADSRVAFISVFDSDTNHWKATLKHFPNGKIIQQWTNTTRLSCDFAPAGSIAHIKVNEEIHVWDLEQEKELHRHKHIHGTFYDPEFSRMAYWNNDSESVEVLNARTMQPIATIKPNLYDPELMFCGLSIDKDELLLAFYLRNQISAQHWNLKDRKLLIAYGPSSGFDMSQIEPWFNADFFVYPYQGGNPLYLWNRRTGEKCHSYIAESHVKQPQLMILKQNQLYVPPEKNPVLIFPSDSYDSHLIPNHYLAWNLRGLGKNVDIYARHRPEEWYGLAWLPEFWATLVLASLFLWNLFRRTK